MHVLTARLFETIVEPDASSILHVFLLSVLCGVLYFPYLGSTAFFDKGAQRSSGRARYRATRRMVVPSEESNGHTFQATAIPLVGSFGIQSTGQA